MARRRSFGCRVFGVGCPKRRRKRKPVKRKTPSSKKRTPAVKRRMIRVSVTGSRGNFLASGMSKNFRTVKKGRTRSEARNAAIRKLNRDEREVGN